MSLSCAWVSRDQRKICRPKNRTTIGMSGMASIDQNASQGLMVIISVRLKTITTTASTIASEPNPISSRTA